MVEENRESMKPQLATALMRGVSVTPSARARNVVRRSVSERASEAALACRRRVLDPANKRVAQNYLDGRPNQQDESIRSANAYGEKRTGEYTKRNPS
jgi:hypothetical protein